ncbi:MAG TPA: TlpA disulfide reductase family protein [Pyrinomonadaceae bacterium]
MEETLNPVAVGKWRGLARLLDPAYVVLSVCVILTLTFLISATRKSESLARQLEIVSKRVDDQALHPGDVVPPFTTVDVDGNRAAVELPAGRKQLLFIFSRYCSVCGTQFPIWERLAREVKSDRLAVQGVALDSMQDTRGYLKGKDPGFQIILAPNDAFSRAYRVERLPQVALISEDGVVEWVGIGALNGEKLAELESKLRRGETASVGAGGGAAAEH